MFELFYQYYILCVSDLGQGEGALYRLWTMYSGVDRNWDGLILGNENNYNFNFIFLAKSLFFLICKCSLIKCVTWDSFQGNWSS